MGQECQFEYTGPAELKARIERALRWVKHPLLGINVLDAGLVLGVQADEQCVCVSMTTTTPDCPLTDVLTEDIEAELFDHLGDGRRVDVQVLSDPVWTVSRMKVVPLDRLGACPWCSFKAPAKLTGVKVCRSPRG